MRRALLLLGVLLAGTLEVSAQRVQVDSLASHVIVDSCSGCGGGGASADITATGTISSTSCPGTGCVGLVFTQPVASVGVDLTSFSGNISFWATIDGTNYQATYCHQAGQFAPQLLSTGSAGLFTCSAAGFAGFRVQATVLTSGTPTVTLRGSGGARSPETPDLYLDGIYTRMFSAFSVSVDGASVPITVEQPTGSDLHIVCDSGCGSPPATADGTAFVAGTTNVSPIAALVDDAATATVAEDAYGAPRMSTNRVLYVDLKQTQANATAIKVDGSAVTQPVSGTVTTTPPSNASTNVVQWNGNTVALNSGTVSAGTLRIAPATDVTFRIGATSPTTGNISSVNSRGVDPLSTDNGLIVRNIPSGTQAISAASLPSHDVTNAGTFAVQVTSAPSTAVTGPLTDAQLRASAVPISAAALPLPAGASTAAKQPALGTAGTASADVLTIQGIASMTKLLVTPDSVALPANQSVNVAQFAGTATSVNSGVKDAGTLRVVLATDQPALTNKLLVTPDSVALPANQSVNVSQIGGNATSTAASGVQKVGLVGNAGAALDAANNAAMPANAIATGVQTATIDTTPTAATAGNLRYQLASTEGVVYVQEGGPKRFSCVVPSTATVTTQCQAAPAAGLRAYVTSVTMSNAAATVQTLDVIYGTGAACVTSPVALTHKVQFGTNATTTSPQSYGMQFQTPLVPAAANAICVRPSAGTAFGATLTGYIAP